MLKALGFVKCAYTASATKMASKAPQILAFTHFPRRCEPRARREVLEHRDANVGPRDRPVLDGGIIMNVYIQAHSAESLFV